MSKSPIVVWAKAATLWEVWSVFSSQCSVLVKVLRIKDGVFILILMLLRYPLLFQVFFQEQLQELLFKYPSVDINNINVNQNWSSMWQTSFFPFYESLDSQEEETLLLIINNVLNITRNTYRKIINSEYIKIYLNKLFIKQFVIMFNNLLKNLSVVSCLPQFTCS